MNPHLYMGPGKSPASFFCGWMCSRRPALSPWGGHRHTRKVIRVLEVSSARCPTPGPTGLTSASTTRSRCAALQQVCKPGLCPQLCSVSRSFGRFRVPETHLNLRRCISVSGRSLIGCCQDGAPSAWVFHALPQRFMVIRVRLSPPGSSLFLSILLSLLLL